MSVEQFWKKFNVLDAIDNIISAWNEVTDQNMKSIWNNLPTDRRISLKIIVTLVKQTWWLKL